MKEKKMKQTNKYNLPKALENVLSSNREPNLENIYVTDLINPPLIYFLKCKHWKEIEEDISDKLWALLGTSVHYILEKGSPEDSLSEQKIEYAFKVDGEIFNLVGHADLYYNNGIEDYKVTSVWSFMYGDKKEWEQQLNCYAFLYRCCGFEIEHLTINAILRDWQKSKVKDGYPEIPFIQKQIPLWSPQEQESFIIDRLRMFAVVKNALTKEGYYEIPMCTKEERWTRYDKKENKEIDIRCENYCVVRDICKNYRKTRVKCPNEIAIEKLYKEKKNEKVS